ncbi:MAG TPA: mycofactocin-coupled SDR family oxidoreductase [Acidimicrobiales bacterium]|nr:mycofactocin-coupled SDR family oxidoreductase [Acidimicrobiales bacterium]
MTERPVAVVTGAGRGIGASTARRLAGAGWRLVLVDRCEDDGVLAYPLATRADLDAVAAECGAVPVVADVRDQAALDAAVAVAVAEFGGLDAAIAVAGCIIGGTRAWETDDDAWSTMVDVNAGGVWRLARAAVPVMLARPAPRQGRFIAVSSAGGVLGMPLLAAYAAAKHAVIGFVRSMAAELGPHGITVNAVAPGSTATMMLEASAGVYGLTTTDDFAAHHQLGRLIGPDEVAAFIAWLCGPESAAITGSVLPVDAGMTAS